MYSIIETPHLTLRILQKKDAPLFLEAVKTSYKSLLKRFSWVALIQSMQTSEKHIADYLLQATLENGGLYGIFFENQFIGALYVHWISEIHQKAEIGFWLKESFRGKGLATEALKALANYLLHDLNLNRLEAHTASDNFKSISLLQRVGFQQEGLCRQYEYLHEKFIDHWQFSLLRTDLRR